MSHMRGRGDFPVPVTKRSKSELDVVTTMEAAATHAVFVNSRMSNVSDVSQVESVEDERMDSLRHHARPGVCHRISRCLRRWCAPHPSHTAAFAACPALALER